MFYKYLYYKMYSWLKSGIEPFYPQVSSVMILTLLPVSNLYLILYILSLLNMYQFDGSFIDSSTAKIFIVVFVSLFVFNQLYFFWINNWKEMILFFKTNNVSRKLNIAINIYVIFSISSYVLIYILDSIVI
jgi:hypothetical protein